MGVRKVKLLDYICGDFTKMCEINSPMLYIFYTQKKLQKEKLQGGQTC